MKLELVSIKTSLAHPATYDVDLSVTYTDPMTKSCSDHFGLFTIRMPKLKANDMTLVQIEQAAIAIAMELSTAQ